MTKELEVVRKLQHCGVKEYREALENVEKILLEYEQIKNANSSEALESFEKLKNHYDSEKQLYFDQTEEYNTIKQALLKTQFLEKENAEYKRVLEIIKEKNVDVYVLKTCINLEHYNSEIRLKNQNNTYSYEIWYELTQEEFDLLKRWQNEITRVKD